MVMACMVCLMGLCRTAANASNYWTTNTLLYTETYAPTLHHFWRCILYRCRSRIDASTVSLNTTILHFGSSSGRISSHVTWRACQCSKSGLARTLPRHLPYAGGGLGSASTSLSQSTTATPRSAVAVGCASRLSGRTSSVGMWTIIGECGTKAIPSSESDGIVRWWLWAWLRRRCLRRLDTGRMTTLRVALGLRERMNSRTTV